MIRAILSDLGNVMVRFEHDRVYRNFSQALSRPADEIRDILTGEVATRLHTSFERGEINDVTFEAELQRLFESALDPKTFWRCHCDMFIPNLPVIVVWNWLKRKNPRLKLIAVSDCDTRRLDYVKSTYDLAFDAEVVSFRVGETKPHRAMFETALAQADVPAEECFFTDDLKENVLAARTHGIIAHQYFSTGALTFELTRLGFKI